MTARAKANPSVYTLSRCGLKQKTSSPREPDVLLLVGDYVDDQENIGRAQLDKTFIRGGRPILTLAGRLSKRPMA